ncbi:MAG: hypothetical protein LUG93_16775 [Lachnospiraceae bacterium]|nr:hypothetical protein [Lachnospiraceae bacterium]
MFRIVGIDENTKNEHHLYLQQIASQTIATGLRACYPSDMETPPRFAQRISRPKGEDATRRGQVEPPIPMRFAQGGSATDADFEIFLDSCLSDGFFKGFAQYVGMQDDMAAGVKFVRTKVNRMLEKLADPSRGYTFDVFEEMLFVIAINWANQDIMLRKMLGEKKKNPYIDRKRQAAVAKELMDRFSYSEKDAKEMAKSLLRFDKMGLDDEDDDESLFFWDDDYAFFFSDSLIEGINGLKGFVGEQMGYGYEYTCGIFSDIGMKPPIMLLGTKEGNRIANEVAAKKYAEKISGMMSNMMPGTTSDDDGYMQIPDDVPDEDLPFN